MVEATGLVIGAGDVEGQAVLEDHPVAIGRLQRLVNALEGLAKVMRRAHPDRVISVDATADASEASARIERRDLEEAVGNLMDNACKFGREQVEVLLSLDRSERHRPEVVVVVHDLNFASCHADHIVAMREGRSNFRT